MAVRRDTQGVRRLDRDSRESFLPLLTLHVLPFTSRLEDGRVVPESFLAELFHQLNGDQGDVVLAGVFFDPFLDHGAQEIGNPVESCF